MGIDIRLPQITDPSEKGQLMQIKSYLFQLAEQLQWALNNVEASNNTVVVSVPKTNPVMVTPRAVSDFVVEQAQAGIWYYRKWHSGIAECWCRRNVDVNVNISWGSALYYGTATTINYPFEFVERPITQITCEYEDDSVSLFIASCGTGTNVYAPPVMLVGTDAKTVNCNILYHAHGRWK